MTSVPHILGKHRIPRLKTVDAARDDTEITLARWALAGHMPILGICRGIQSLNVAAGGDLFQDLPDQRPGSIRHSYPFAESPWERPTHAIRVEARSQLAGVLGTVSLMTNSFHHQAVRAMAPGFVPVAWAKDGVIEGMENPDRSFAVAVQWHPEAMVRDDVHARNLFTAFVAAARRFSHQNAQKPESTVQTAL